MLAWEIRPQRPSTDFAVSIGAKVSAIACKLKIEVPESLLHPSFSMDPPALRGVVRGFSVAAHVDVVLAAVGRLVAYEPDRRAARRARLPDRIEHRLGDRRSLLLLRER